MHLVGEPEEEMHHPREPVASNARWKVEMKVMKDRMDL